ncbi:hypothetical protein ME121_5055 [Methylobacterium sp. ME121]|nr:hypothetical protein ME121_5055 [Methylobacterium sp. ME121]
MARAEPCAEGLSSCGLTNAALSSGDGQGFFGLKPIRPPPTECHPRPDPCADDPSRSTVTLRSRIPIPMPIRPEHRFFYPIDWPQLSAVIRFGRAQGRCEGCGRPHGRTVVHLGDGRWWDADAASWRDRRGRRVRVQPGAVDVLRTVRRTRVVLAAAHRDHDTANNADANLAAFCQRCHIIHDRPEHRRRRWTTLFRRKALGDLFRGPYA